MKLRSVFSACSARSSHWCCSCSNFALVTGSAAASAAAAHLRANCRNAPLREAMAIKRERLRVPESEAGSRAGGQAAATNSRPSYLRRSLRGLLADPLRVTQVATAPVVTLTGLLSLF
jgi:hypothetical protein